MQLIGLKIWRLLFSGFCLMIIYQLFSIQFLQAERYRDLADRSQVKSYQIEASRGHILAYDGDDVVPVVVNQRRWLLFGDTKFISDLDLLVETLAKYDIEISQAKYQKLQTNSRYVVLKRGLTDEKKAALEATKLKGIYYQKQSIRDYIEDDLAAHVLGFLNTDSKGQYGVEQYYNQQLTGQPGFAKVLTDVRGVPLTLSEDNIRVPPVDGSNITLTLDVPLQRAAEIALGQGIAKTSSISGNVIILDANSGAIKAMANYPTFNPAEFATTESKYFINASVNHVLEPGSTIKMMSMSTALNEGAVAADDSFYNGLYKVADGHQIRNVLDRYQGQQSMTDVMRLSLNLGTVYLLEQLGGETSPDYRGTQARINPKARQILYDYYVNRFRFGQPTGVDLPGEVAGTIHPPDERDGPNIRYANMTFGQGMTVNLLQLAVAYGAIFNDGAYYQPYIVDRIGANKVEPRLIANDILKPTTTTSIRLMMEEVGRRVYPELQYQSLEVSAKTGTGENCFTLGGLYRGGIQWLDGWLY